MAGKSVSKKGGNEWNSDVSYADVRLSSADKDAFLNWTKGVSQDFSTALTMVLDESYRVTFKYDYNNSCHVCTFTQQDNKHHNRGLAIMSRSDEPEEAFWLNVYKVHVLYEGQRIPTQTEGNTWG